MPSIGHWAVSAPFQISLHAGANVPVTKLLFPLPDTPVTATMQPMGISINMLEIVQSGTV